MTDPNAPLTQADHYALAADLLRQADWIADQVHGYADPGLPSLIGRAQVHALLALVGDSP